MSHEQGFQWDAPRISLITNREPPTIHLLERIIVDSGDRSPELSHPNMESLPYILHFPSIKNYTLWSSIMAIKNGPSKGSIFHCYRTATAQHPENAGEVLEGFLLSLSFLSFFSLGFGPLNIALQKSCLSGRAHHTGRVRCRGVCITDVTNAWGMAQSFLESPKDLQKICFGMPFWAEFLRLCVSTCVWACFFPVLQPSVEKLEFLQGT